MKAAGCGRGLGGYMPGGACEACGEEELLGVDFRE